MKTSNNLKRARATYDKYFNGTPQMVGPRSEPTALAGED